jgi:RNA polymerase-binding transcription factor DksA
MNKILFLVLMVISLNTIVAAEGKPWTIVKSKIDDAFWSGLSSGDIRLGDAKPGTNVVPLKRGGNYYQVKFPDGQIGWMHSDLLKKNKLSDNTLAQYNYRKGKHYRKDKFENQVLGTNKADLSDQFGTPDAIKHNSKTKETWYYSKFVLVSSRTRHRRISIQIEQDKVTALNLLDKGRSYWVEALPLAYTIRGMTFLNVTEPGDPLRFTKNWHWSLKILLRLLWIALAFLFFSIAGVTAYKLSGFFQQMEILSNGTVKIAGFTVMLVFNYIYFLWLSLHMVRHIDGFMSVFMIVLFLYTFKRYNTRTNYHRCSKCHSMGNVEDQGTAEVGRTHLTERKSKEVYSHSTQEPNYYGSEPPYITKKHYKTITWDEKTTRIDYEDYRKCKDCGHQWSIAHSETVDGHV